MSTETSSESGDASRAADAVGSAADELRHELESARRDASGTTERALEKAQKLLDDAEAALRKRL
ncbi:hypothetical protein [Natronoarchaeum rubrum]|uniref:hypothetical protein n=1 Tax=Natronoarchaeum rubrum TaxID=755311 RepID=UPI0021123B6D|nr:hypothetical protein [Natronoarchaeum rubrum]